ncbi:MAG TPA: ABC transporter ATP-binding protein [Acidimicrobiales bacterium]|nr:ABC transporter ATP-binding protein [Acidimicrobiales bacterium]
MTSLHVTDVHKAFGSHAVLTGIDLTVPEGSLAAILGPSGSGKTTLLRVLAGFERADQGTIVLGDHVVDDGRRFVPSERRGIGYVPQEGALFPHLTVLRNVAFGVPRRERPARKLDELLEMVGLSGLGGRYPHQLSGGQQQRVALARALAIRPGIVLLDEPFSSLDAGLRSSVRADVQRVLREQGTTALLVTHDQDEALSLAEQVAVIRHGRVGQTGSPQNLYAHPGDPGIARFLGDANLVPCTVEGAVATTPFGLLPVRAGGAAPASRHSIALVRPEQLVVSIDPQGPGLAARVVRNQFHGHDTVITVEPEEPIGTPLVVVRSDGELDAPVGARVTIVARGEVVTWPDEESARSVLEAVEG